MCVEKTSWIIAIREIGGDDTIQNGPKTGPLCLYDRNLKRNESVYQIFCCFNFLVYVQRVGSGKLHRWHHLVKEKCPGLLALEQRYQYLCTGNSAKPFAN